MKFRILTLFLLAAMILSLFSGCAAPSETAVPETAAPTEPAATVPADGDPDDVTCKGSYTATAELISARGESAVAFVGSGKLTLSQLQLYYWLTVAEYRLSDAEPSPDFSEALDSQTCPLDDSINSWQQYFLREALNRWHSREALLQQSQDQPLPTDAYFAPDARWHSEYLPDDMPAARYLYDSSYEPNEQHQAWLDGLPETLTALAKDNGFSDTDAQAQAIAGSADGEDLASYAETLNGAYFYFTELGYHIEPTEEELLAHYEANKAQIDALEPAATVDIRHVLLLPEKASVAADGTVTAAEEDWEACLTRADGIVAEWQDAVAKTRFAVYSGDDVPEARFFEIAAEYSADTGSAYNGGLYTDVEQGQLLPELDAWCFDPARQAGDWTVLRAADGCHILFFSDSREGWQAAAEEQLIRQQYEELFAEAMESYPMEVAWHAIHLSQPEDNGSFVTDTDLLYPDVAHQRYPSPPLYIQQDFPDARYGNWLVSSHGCGISSLAMLASYYTDTELTPAELAARYGYYCTSQGSDVVLFDNTPAELGFRLRGRGGDWSEIHAALEEGCTVVSLQHAGYWTRGGHYIPVTDVTEDGKYVVRDSNLYNYQRLTGHWEDAHTAGSITAAGQFYWIYEPKVTRCDACTRCSEELAATGPEAYLCSKCRAATVRREAFLP